jgi:hypothetical protein
VFDSSSNINTQVITVVDYGNYWRLQVNFQDSASNTQCRVVLYPAISSNGTSISTSATGLATVWGAQLEAGAFATSYIPTVASQVTRNADVATMTGTNFSDWFNATEGAFVVQATSPNTTIAAGNLYTVANGDNVDPRINLGRINATTLRARVLISGSVQADLDRTVAQQITHCFAYKQDSFAAALNGSAVVTDTLGNVPTTLNKLHIGKYPNAIGGDWNGQIQKIMYYPQRLTNAEVQAFSKG